MLSEKELQKLAKTGSQFRELVKEIRELREYKADIENATKFALNPPQDEQHCTCVPLLIVEAKKLRKALEELEYQASSFADEGGGEMLKAIEQAKKALGIHENTGA